MCHFAQKQPKGLLKPKRSIVYVTFFRLLCLALGAHSPAPFPAPSEPASLLQALFLSSPAPPATMKLLAVALYHHKGPEVEPACLGLAAELSSFGYFQRASVKEMLSFLSKTIVQRTAAGQRQTVKQEDYFCHVHVKDGGIAGVAVTDRDYPTIAAFSVVGKAVEEYLQLGDESWRTQTEDGTQALAVVEAAVTRYQVCAAAPYTEVDCC